LITAWLALADFDRLRELRARVGRASSGPSQRLHTDLCGLTRRSNCFRTTWRAKSRRCTC